MTRLAVLVVYLVLGCLVVTSEARTRQGFGAACSTTGYNWRDGDGYTDLCQRGQRPPAGNRWHADKSKRYEITNNVVPRGGKGVSKGGKAYTCKDTNRVTITEDYVRCVAQAAVNIGYGSGSTVTTIVDGCGSSIAHALDEFGITCRSDAVTGIMGSLVYETRNFATFIQPCDKGVGGFHMTDTNWRSMGSRLTKNFNKWFGLSLSSSQMQDAFTTRGLAIHAAAWWWAKRCSSRRAVTANTARDCIFAGDGSHERIKVYNAVARCESKLGKGGSTISRSQPSSTSGGSPGGNGGKRTADTSTSGTRDTSNEETAWDRIKKKWREKGWDNKREKADESTTTQPTTSTSTGRGRRGRDQMSRNTNNNNNNGGSTNSGPSSSTRWIKLSVNINQSTNFWVQLNLPPTATIADVKEQMEKKHSIDPKWCSIRTSPDSGKLPLGERVSNYVNSNSEGRVWLTWP
eukprot:TRINITY_DN37360_c0_g1_i1.p1 TRINITY_DN37360_c0_g1~~TRINITY_DN37360_c0_g1_i1.p1  ORF type:complete len:475 (+),score=112.65 TRINITY_DN37360_c0_g1_i1:46-1425(+)